MPRRSAPLTIPRLSSLLPQTEKAYQKQVGVNVGYVSTRCVSRRPRSDPSGARRDEKLIRENTAHRDLPFPSAPADSPLPPRRRRPARLAPATTRTSVSASRLPVRLSRVRAVAAPPRARSRQSERRMRVSNRAFSLQTRRGFSHPLVERRSRRSLQTHTSSLTFYSFSYTSSSLL
jgi:hypothetical protein